MRKLILIAGLVITGACASTSSADGPVSGWSQAQYSEGREAFFSGYGSPDSFGICAWDYLTNRYSHDGFVNVAQRDGIDGMIDDATLACQHRL